MSMTIEEAISLYEESERINKELAEQCESATAKNHNLDNAEKCRQMIAWLRELQERQKAPEIIYCKDCKALYCNFCLKTLKPVEKEEKDYCSLAERRTE